MYSYKITEKKIVDADGRTMFVPTAPDEVLTLSTCYPFNFVGSEPDRYIFTALPIEETGSYTERGGKLRRS
ncbi:sortase domain-containing protein [Virgibacillus kimchii]